MPPLRATAAPPSGYMQRRVILLTSQSRRVAEYVCPVIRGRFHSCRGAETAAKITATVSATQPGVHDPKKDSVSILCALGNSARNNILFDKWEFNGFWKWMKSQKKVISEKENTYKPVGMDYMSMRIYLLFNLVYVLIVSRMGFYEFTLESYRRMYI